MKFDLGFLRKKPLPKRDSDSVPKDYVEISETDTPLETSGETSKKKGLTEGDIYRLSTP